MHRIHYAAGSVLTGDDIAHALITYAKALALSVRSDTVSFPVALPDGTTGVAEVLIGPASQIMSVSEAGGLPEIVDPDLVTELETMAESLGMSKPEAEARPENGDPDYGH